MLAFSPVARLVDSGARPYRAWAQMSLPCKYGSERTTLNLHWTNKHEDASASAPQLNFQFALMPSATASAQFRPARQPTQDSCALLSTSSLAFPSEIVPQDDLLQRSSRNEGTHLLVYSLAQSRVSRPEVRPKTKEVKIRFSDSINKSSARQSWVLCLLLSCAKRSRNSSALEECFTGTPASVFILLLHCRDAAAVIVEA